jgi:predicted nucleic acid-binding protein
MVAERVLLDTNLLISASDQGRPDHARAVEFLEEDPRELVIAPQNVREFLAVATRAEGENGLGMSPEHAARALADLMVGLTLVGDGKAAASRLLSLIVTGPASGKQVHDASLVATALASEVGTIVTANRRHFERFADLIEIESLGR